MILHDSYLKLRLFVSSLGTAGQELVALLDCLDVQKRSGLFAFIQPIKAI